jgi:sulfonate transport system ATP-binding protein
MSRPTTSTAVRVRGVHKSFGANEILRRIDLDIRAGEFVALLGASGSGKTTLLRMLAGLDAQDRGEIQTPAVKAVAFQEPRLMPWLRVQDNVELGLTGPGAAARARRALTEVGLSHRLDAWPATLSGGEAQRAALARALAREPGLLLLDEPFSALDALTRIRMHGLTLELWRAHQPAVLLVTHDVDEALHLADRVVVLVKGELAADIALPARELRRQPEAGIAGVKRRVLSLLGVEAELIET